MIKIKVHNRKMRLTVKGERFETANEAVNVAISLADHFEEIDPALGHAIRKTIVDEMSKKLPELAKEEPEAAEE